MASKLRSFDQQFLKDLKNSGLTYQQMMDKHLLTRWGARKLGNHPDIEEDRSGKEKIFYIDQETDSLLNLELPTQSLEPNHEETRRNTQKAKQTITKEASTYLKQLEQEVKTTETEEVDYSEPGHDDNGFTAVIHETDPHFSAQVKNRDGIITYDREKAKTGTRNAFNWYAKKIMEKQRYRDLDNIVLMLGGDLVEGENIYEGQAHKVEETLEKQIETARRTYYQQIEFLKSMFEVPLKIVAVSGNHGDLPTSSSSNADDIIYSMLEDMISLSDIENVKMVRSDRTDGLTFNYRCWKGYVCHGENRSNHIGTSSPQSDWLALKERLGFDAAWRGHYHNQKQENINGTPVIMTGSRKPGDDYTDKIATFGVTNNAIYFSTNEEPVSDIKIETEVHKTP